MTEEQRLTESYRGHDIEVSREESMGAGELTYFNIYRASDGYECVCSFTYGEDPLPTVMQWMRELVDEALASDDPWDERAEEMAL